MSERYDAGLLNDYGGGNIEWWHDYIRAELGRAEEFYEQQLQQARREGWEQAKMEAADQCSNLTAYTLAESDMMLACCCTIDAMSYKEAT